MAKSIYKTEQKFRRPEAIALLALFSGLVLYKTVASLFFQGNLGGTEIVTLMSILLIGWLLLLSYKMRVSINKNALKIKYSNVFERRARFNKEEINYIQFVEMPEAAMWNGMAVHSDLNYAAHGMGDNTGIQISMKNGEEVVIYSNRIYNDRSNLTKKLNAAGYKVV